MSFLKKIFLSKKIKRFSQRELDTNLIKECKKCSNKNNFENIKLLIENGADINTRDRYVFEDKKGVQLLSAGKTTPLMFACSLRSIKVIKFLLENGANPNLKNSSGKTALMMSLMRGIFEIIKILLENGANPEIEDLGHANAIDITIDFLNIHSLNDVNPYPSLNISIPLYIFQSLSRTTIKNQIKEYKKTKDYLILWTNTTTIQRRYRRKLQQRIGEYELLANSRIPEDVVKEIIKYI